MIPIMDAKNVRMDRAILQPIPSGVLLLFTVVPIAKLSYFPKDIGDRFAVQRTKKRILNEEKIVSIVLSLL